MANPVKTSSFTAPPLLSPYFETDSKGKFTQVIARPWVEYFRAITNELGAQIPVTGSIASGDALKSLLSALSKLGFIVDQTTP